MREDYIEYEYFKSFLLILYLYMKKKNYLQVYLDNCAYKIANKRMTDYLNENLFED